MSRRPSLRLLIPAFLGLALPCAGQVVLHDNQIVGDVTFTNAHPEIVSVLSRALQRSETGARSDAPPLSSAGTATGTTLGAVSYELTVDTVDAGLAHQVQVALNNDGLFFATRSRTSPAVLPLPAPPVRLDIDACLSMVRVEFRDDAGELVVVRDGQIRILPDSDWTRVARQYAHYPGETHVVTGTGLEAVAEADGRVHDIEVEFEYGTDPYHDTLRYRRVYSARLDCDVVTVIGVTCDSMSTGDGALPRIVGELDILGHHELHRPRSSTQVDGWGPLGNHRKDFIDSDPSSGSFELENLLPSSWAEPPEPWKVDARSCLDMGVARGEFFQQGTAWVPATGTVDFGDLFVVDPGTVVADLRLEGPPGVPDPLLSRLRLFPDRDDDGAPDDACIMPSQVTAMSGMAWSPAPGILSWRGSATTGIAGSYAPADARFSGTARTPIGGYSRTERAWGVDFLRLEYPSTDALGGATSVPEGSLSIHYERPAVTARPGETLAVPFHACLSEVHVTVLADGVTFFQPRVDVSEGGFDGLDFEGRRVTYTALASSEGTPIAQADASTEGHARMLLPEGEYELGAWVRALNPGGGLSQTEVRSIPVHVGCGQILSVSNQLALSVKQLPSCTGPGLLRVTGSVRSVRDVVRIAWSLDGGPWTDACAPCGVNPDYAIDVNVPSADSRLVVRAWDVTGLMSEVIAFTGLTGEPSALDIRPASPPFRVTRFGGELHLSWEPRPSDRYTVHAGSLASLRPGVPYDHGAIEATCRQPGASMAIPLPATDTYLLVTEACERGFGSFGRDSFGRERPGARTGCP